MHKLSSVTGSFVVSHFEYFNAAFARVVMASLNELGERRDRRMVATVI